MIHQQPFYIEVIMGFLGAVIGIGRMMINPGRITMRLLIGRAIISGGIAIAAGSILLLIPNAPVVAVLGLSAAFATLGADGVERMLVRYFKLERRERREDS